METGYHSGSSVACIKGKTEHGKYTLKIMYSQEDVNESINTDTETLGLPYPNTVAAQLVCKTGYAPYCIAYKETGGDRSMGMVANYMMVSEAELAQMMKMDGGSLLDRIDEIEEDEDPELYCLDKLWDGLHFLLTGVSASEPIEDNKLSEAVVGVHVFDVDPGDGFVGCTEHHELAEIIAAMTMVKISEICAQTDFSLFRKNNIYPSIWEDNEKENILQELIQEFHQLILFYQSALKAQKHVIISIF